ncbi:MAG: cytochrome c biogenesis protein CcsA [Vampirovibrionales bacterium]
MIPLNEWMLTASQATLLSQAVAYGVACLLLALAVCMALPAWRTLPWLGTVTRWSYAGITLALVGVFVVRSLAAEFFALTNMYESILAVVCGLTASTWVTLQARPREDVGLNKAWIPVLLGGQGLMLALLALALFRLDASLQPLMPSLVSYWRAIHVPLIMFSYSLMFSASIAGVCQLCLPAKHEHQAVLAQWALRHVQFAFPTLAVGVILGAIWANEAWGTYWNWDPKENMALATLLLYAGYWHLSLNEAWSLRALAWLLVGGLLMLLLTYFGVNLLGVGLHSYGKF